jgi:head-tail adaptor
VKAGKLRHVIRLERATTAPDAYGTPVEAWATLATLRAEKVSEGLAEKVEGSAGAVDAVAIVWRVRALYDLKLSDRIMWGGKPYNLTMIDFSDAGRGLELHCEGKP